MTKPKILFFVLPFLIAVKVQAIPVPHSLFSDHAILQQKVAVPVWGTARDGEKISLEFAGQKVSTIAKNGKWMLKLSPLKAGGPYTITIIGDSTIHVRDILVGEVWVCSGQSNMERQLGPRPGQKLIVGWEAARDQATSKSIRQYKVAYNSSDKPVDDVKRKWVICSPETVIDFSAVGYFFARDLHKRLKVPIGLLFSAVGGSPAESWTSYAALEGNPELNRVAKAYQNAVKKYPEVLEKYRTDESALMKKYEADLAQAKKDSKPLPRKPAEPKEPSKTGVAGGLYHGMISPLQPYAIKGVIWYQGEANSGGDTKFYQSLFPALIADWRKAWGQGEFPFLFVQIAPFERIGPQIRESQLISWQKTPNTAMVVTTDCGDALDIHPADKEPVGVRLALAARALAYKENIEYSGPVYREIKVEGAKAILSFKHQKKLVAKGGVLKGFTIAGKDNVFVPATALIKGSLVEVFSSTVDKPIAVRYGWENVPEASLYNEKELPASPFRTDVVY